MVNHILVLSLCVPFTLVSTEEVSRSGHMGRPAHPYKHPRAGTCICGADPTPNRALHAVSSLLPRRPKQASPPAYVLQVFVAPRDLP